VAIETVTIPDLGGAESVEVIELCATAGDAVEQEDSLVVLESDKASMDVPSPVDGSVVKYLVAEGDTVKVGDAIAEIETSAADTVTEEVVEVQPASQPEPVAEEVEVPQAAAVPETSEQIALVPDIGSDDKVELIEVSVAVGDQVEEGETLVVLESDKATMDVPSSLTGTVVSMIAKEGDKLGTGDQVAVIEVSGSSDSAVQDTDPEPQSQAVTETFPPATAPEVKSEPVSFPSVETSAPLANGSAEIYAGPSVRLLSRELVGSSISNSSKFLYRDLAIHILCI